MPHRNENLAALRDELNTLLGEKKHLIAGHSEFIAHAFGERDPSLPPPSPLAQLELFSGEAAQALAMIQAHLRPGMRILEVGGGIGLTYAYLRSRGYDVVSLEPGSQGFGDRHRAGLFVLGALGVDPTGWIKCKIEDLSATLGKFDLIFSYFVLEHLQDAGTAFGVMTQSLSGDGILVHRCPNYSIPYEPHLNIILVPLFPRFTENIMRSLKKNALWSELQFTTYSSIKKLCHDNGLVVIFSKGMLAWALDRMLYDKSFFSRKKLFIYFARALKAINAIQFIAKIHPAMATPIDFFARKVSKK